jgi:hypothetical protein
MHDTHKRPSISPEHAEAMGYVVSAWALLEEHHAWLIGNLLDLQEDVSAALIAEMSELQRVNVITALVTLAGKAKWMDEWAAISHEVKRLRPLKNNAIHSATWGYSAEDLSIRRYSAQHLSARVNAKGKVSITHAPVETSELFLLAQSIRDLTLWQIKFNARLKEKGAAKRLNRPDLGRTAHTPVPSGMLLAQAQKGSKKQSNGDRARRSDSSQQAH